MPFIWHSSPVSANSSRRLVEQFDALRSPAGQRCLHAAQALDLSPASLLADVAALRLRFPAALVSATVTQVRLRRRAESKFGADAAAMYFTATGLQQATRATVARHRAARFAGLGQVSDLCCGIGGDLIALSRQGLAVRGVDADPLTVAVARANVSALGLAAAQIREADVTDVPLTGMRAAFIDPSRRVGGRRRFDPSAYSPPWNFILRLTDTVPALGVKLAPGIDHALVPDGAEAEWVSDGGELKEAALWFGPLAGARHRATLLPSGATLTGTGAAAGRVGPLAGWLGEPDPAVIRAGLVAEVATVAGATLIDPSIAYLSTPSPAGREFVRWYQVVDSLPFSMKRLRTVLRASDVGPVVIKKRGSALDPDDVRRQLRLTGSQPMTVVLTRLAGAPTAILCRPT